MNPAFRAIAGSGTWIIFCLAVASRNSSSVVLTALVTGTIGVFAVSNRALMKNGTPPNIESGAKRDALKRLDQ